jgi:hypothetical protein
MSNTIISGYVQTLSEARELATTYPHDYEIRTEVVELQGSSKPGRLWVTYVAELSTGATFRANIGTEPMSATRAGFHTEGERTG